MVKQTQIALILAVLASPNTLFAQGSTAPRPISEEARKHFVMGSTLFKDAKTADDLSQVESEFKQAADLAPEWPEARYNLALIKEAASDYSGAMADLKLYQLFKLSDDEARAVQDKIYALEAKREAIARKRAKEENSAAAEERKKQDYGDKIGFLAGLWNVSSDTGEKAVITITGRDVLITRPPESRYGPMELLKGTMEGDDYSSIKWVQRGHPNSHTANLPDIPVDVTFNKIAHQINWKSHWVDTSTSPFSWSLNMVTDYQLTK